MKILIIIVFHSASLLCQLTHSGFSDTIGSNPGNIALADSLYNFTAAKLSFLDYNDCNNCPLRAHVMTFVFAKTFPELKIGKVWLIADSKLASRRDYYKTHKREFLNGMEQCPQWGFHVAPVVIFGYDTLVIDPSTQSAPVNLNKWAGTITTNTASFLIIKDEDYYSYPEDGNDNFNDIQQTWEMKYVFISNDGEINFLADKLTKAYHKIFDPVKFNYYKNKLSAIIAPYSLPEEKEHN